MRQKGGIQICHRRSVTIRAKRRPDERRYHQVCQTITEQKVTAHPLGDISSTLASTLLTLGCQQIVLSVPMKNV